MVQKRRITRLRIELRNCYSITVTDGWEREDKDPSVDIEGAGEETERSFTVS